MAFKVSPFHKQSNGSPFQVKSPLNELTSEESPLARRDQSKKEVRLSKKLKTTKKENAVQYFEDTGKGSDRRERKGERKELRVEQKLKREQKKQSPFTPDKVPKGDRKADRQERKELRSKQKDTKKRKKAYEAKKREDKKGGSPAKKNVGNTRLTDKDVERKLTKAGRKLKKVNSSNSNAKNERKLAAAGKVLNQVEANSARKLEEKNLKENPKPKEYGDNVFTTPSLGTSAGRVNNVLKYADKKMKQK